MAPRYAQLLLGSAVAIFLLVGHEMDTAVFQVQTLQFRMSRETYTQLFLADLTSTDSQRFEESSKAARVEEPEKQTVQFQTTANTDSEMSSNKTASDKQELFEPNRAVMVEEQNAVEVKEQNAVEIKADATDPRPRNLRIVFMGDSVTRYQYIALAYFLKTGHWLTEGYSPNPLHTRYFGGRWNNFFQGSNSILRPEEQCDCIMQLRGNYTHGYSENRYFSNPEQGNYVAFIGRFAFQPMAGHWQPESAFNSTADKIDIVNYKQPDVLPYLWDFSAWNETIVQHIAKLVPRPDFLVFNAGIHPNHMWKPEVHNGILEAAKAVGIIPIYKTTTYSKTAKRGSNHRHNSHNNLLCEIAPYCLDMSWTGDIEGPDHYYDNWHFKPDVKKRMNMQLLEYVQMIISSGGNTTSVYNGTEMKPKLP